MSGHHDLQHHADLASGLNDHQENPHPLADSILVGDVRQKLAEIPPETIDCIVTSPPYFRLRNYGKDEQIGLERHVDSWVDELLLVARGLHRVLRPGGSFWLNLGDTFARHQRDGARPKSLVLAPERLALAMVQDGWVLRNKVIWSKPNPMPTSVKDRLSCTWEALYFFNKNENYHFDLDAIRVPHRSGRGVGSALARGASSSTTTRAGGRRPASSPSSSSASTSERRGSRLAAWSVPPEWRGPAAGSNSGLDRLKASGLPGHPLGKNPGDVWSIPTAGYRGAHHAVFPVALAERPIRASCPPGGVVLDPFMGSGTTAIAAEKHGRQWIGIELNPEFASLAMSRIEGEREKRQVTAVEEVQRQLDDEQRDSEQHDELAGARERRQKVEATGRRRTRGRSTPSSVTAASSLTTEETTEPTTGLPTAA